MKKKIICILCAVALLLAVLCGCAGSTASGSTSTDPATSEPAADSSMPDVSQPAEPGASEPPSETVYAKHDYELPLSNADESFSFFIGVAPFLNGIVSGFDDNYAWQLIQERTGVSIEFYNVPGQNESTQFQLMLAADDLPELIHRGVWMYGSADAAINDGYFVDLYPYLDEYAPNFNYYLNQDNNIRRMTITDSGGIASFVQFKTDIMFNEGYAVRNDWLEKTGLETPKTYDDVYNMLKSFQSELDIASPMALTYSEGVGDRFSWGYGISGGVMVKDGKVTWGVLTDEYYDYLCMIKQWYDEGLIDPEGYSYTNSNDFSKKALNSEVGFYYTQSNNIAGWIDGNVDSDARLTAINDVTIEADEALHFSPMMINTMEGKDTFVNTKILSLSTNCHNVELAVTLIDYLYSDEGSLICNYGVEGETYTMVDGKPQFTDMVLKNDLGISLENSFNVYCMQYGPFVEDYNRVSSNWDDRVLAACKVWSSAKLGDSYAIPAYGVELTSEESSEYSLIYADIEVYIMEYQWKFISGEMSLDDYFTTYVETIKSMNIDRCIEIYQAAYDRYIAH